MRITVIGAGHIGATVGRLWCRAGHDVQFTTRHPEQLKGLVASIGKRASFAPVKQAVQFGEAILLAVPLKAVPELGREIDGLIIGTPVLDATNPYPERDGDFARQAIEQGHGSSVWTAARLPGARVVKAFNMQRYDMLQKMAHHSADPLLIALASDDAAALEIAKRLVVDAGFEPFIAGKLEDGHDFDPGSLHYANGFCSSQRRDKKQRDAARTSASGFLSHS